MTKIDFYVLPDEDLHKSLLFTCRLTEKALKQKNKILIVLDDRELGAQLDKLMWEFTPHSFVPHALSDDKGADNTPVLICHDDSDHDIHDVLVNIGSKLPPQFSRFKRHIEVVRNTPEALAASRKHYAYFKARGYPIDTHKIS